MHQESMAGECTNVGIVTFLDGGRELDRRLILGLNHRGRGQHFCRIRDVVEGRTFFAKCVCGFNNLHARTGFD